MYAAAMSPSIQPPLRAGSAQPATTSSKAESIRISKRADDCRSERLTRSPSSGSTPRCSGDHQPSGVGAEVDGHREQALPVGSQQRAGFEVGPDRDQVAVAGRRGREGPGGRGGLDGHSPIVPGLPPRAA